MRSHNDPAADAYAGLNWFSGDAPVREAVRAETERNAPARRAEAKQETTGPPEGQGALYIEKSKSALESNPNSNAYEPIQAVGEYTERLVRMESALETADTAVMEEGKNRYEARITEEDGYVYAYCGQRKTRFMSIHSSAPQSVGSAAASAVHVQLPVSFFTERSVVEHGQCIIVKTITHAAVFSVQPFASSIPLIAEAESVRFSVPSAI